MPTVTPDIEIRIVGGLAYPIAKRKKGSSSIDECPFCGEQHAHGKVIGYRTAECSVGIGERKIKGYLIPTERGYIIEEYPEVE